MKRTLVFDMDGTLSKCAEYYKAVMQEFADFKAASLGLPVDACLKVLQEIDLAATGTPDAFKRHRFPRSFMAASYALDTIAEQSLDVAAAERAYRIGDSVFDAEYELFPGALDALHAFEAQGWQLVLVTKGDWGVQWSKVHRNGLDKVFALDRIYVTLMKSAELLQQVATEQQIDVANSWVIGDSLKDDIWPGQQLGFHTCLINSNHKWVYDKHDHADPEVIIDSVAAFIPPVLEAV